MVPGTCGALDVDRSRSASPSVDGNLLYSAVRAQVGAMANGLWPVGHVRAGDALARAAALAGATVVAGQAAVVLLGNDRGVERPPMPAQAMKAAGRGARELSR